MTKWRNAYIKRKAQNAKRKDGLMPIAWHPSRWWDWGVPEEEKKETEKFIFFDHLICGDQNCINKRRCSNLVRKRLGLKTSMDKDK